MHISKGIVSKFQFDQEFEGHRFVSCMTVKCYLRKTKLIKTKLIIIIIIVSACE